MSLDVQHQQLQQQQQQQQQLQLDGLNHLMEAATALARLTNNHHHPTPSLAAWASTKTSPFVELQQQHQQHQKQQQDQGFLTATTAAATTSALDRSTSVVSDEEDSSPKQAPPQSQITNKNTHKKKNNLKASKTSKPPRAPTSPAAKPPAAQQREIFPQRLLAILNDTSLSDIVSWLPHGRSFVIIRPDVFTEHVLPKYLPPAVDVAARSGNVNGSATKYPSFTRKLNRWYVGSDVWWLSFTLSFTPALSDLTLSVFFIGLFHNLSGAFVKLREDQIRVPFIIPCFEGMNRTCVSIWCVNDHAIDRPWHRPPLLPTPLVFYQVRQVRVVLLSRGEARERSKASRQQYESQLL